MQYGQSILHIGFIAILCAVSFSKLNMTQMKIYTKMYSKKNLTLLLFKKIMWGVKFTVMFTIRSNVVFKIPH